MGQPDEIPIAGCRGLDHTADVGFEIHAPDLGALFCRAALGAIWLVLERSAETTAGDDVQDRDGETRSVELVEDDLAMLLRSWLRTVLFWQEMEEFVVMDARLVLLPTPLCSSTDGLGYGLRGEIVGRFDRGPRIREIKGVTLHGLCVEPREDGWLARVILDV